MNEVPSASSARPPAEPSEILVVDDDPGAIHLLARILADCGRIRFATSGRAALRLARETVPDLVLLDAEMPEMSGFDVCKAMKADPVLAAVPVVFVTAHSDTRFELSGFEHGAVDFIRKPVSEPLVRARVRTQLRVKRLHDELQRVSTIDALTGVANRRQFDSLLEFEWQRSLRSGGSIALLMVDVDHFKRFNDFNGHPAGDLALQAVAQALSASCGRPADRVARYGGEEFALLLPETGEAGSRQLAERVVECVNALNVPHGDSPTAAHVTVSVGIGIHDHRGSACRDRGLDGPPRAAELVAAADRALYLAKRAGRCRSHCLQTASTTSPCAPP